MEHIESYLEGNINRTQLEELVAPEEKTTLDENIDWFKRSKLAIEAAGLQAQLKEIVSQEEEKKEETKVISIKKPYQTWYWAAASVVIIVAAFIGIYNNQANLYDQHLYTDPGLPVLMSQSDQYQLYDAMSYYSEGNYEVAAQKLTELEKTSNASDTISYYLGASLLYQGKASEAISHLAKVQDINASAFKEKADWLMILANLKEEKLEEVKADLSQILSNNEHQFYKEAIKLESDLN